MAAYNLSYNFLPFPGQDAGEIQDADDSNLNSSFWTPHVRPTTEVEARRKAELDVRIKNIRADNARRDHERAERAERSKREFEHELMMRDFRKRELKRDR